ncbi:MAG TPA: phosphocholine cytidylyltransferase family protein [Rhodospirillales bacterium]|jgi:choline kinase|nr:phosphocholine cytidylyltransferase family protein [Rhodospirillales bacterium]
MRAIILAAGRGTRLHPHTENTPKCLTELGGMTLIGRQVATLRSGGVDDIVIAAGYKAEMLELPGTRMVLNPNWEFTNMVETLFCAEAEFGEEVIVSYGDIVYEPRVLAALLTSRYEISVAVDENWRAYWEHRFEDPSNDAESLRLNEEGRITDIGNPVSDISEIEAQYMGLMRFKGGGVRALKEARNNFSPFHRPWMENRPPEQAYMTDLLMEMVLMGFPVHAVPVEGGWLEIDTVKDYETAAAMIENGTIDRFFDPSASV